MLHLFKIILFISLLLLLPDQFTVHTKTKIPSSSGNTIVDTSLITYPIYDIVFKTNTIEFDALGLSSGIYFYRIDAEDFSSTRKMLFLK